MPRFVAPELFLLRLAELNDALAAGLVQKVEDALGPLLRKREHDTREPGVPVSLRWLLNPVLGFPRQPFEVWRRLRKEEPDAAVLPPPDPEAPRTAMFSDEAIEVSFVAQPAAGNVLSVEAISAARHTIPGQRLTFSSSQSGRFRAAGIAGLRLRGAGRVTNVRAIRQQDWANLPDWQRIETVGFPFAGGELPAAAYNPAKQGFEFPSLSGPEAALVRLQMAQLLQLDPPAVGAAGIVGPPWPFPDPAGFLDVLRKGPLDDVAQCLVQSDDSDPDNLQAQFAVHRSLPGLRQPGQPPAPDPAAFALTTTRYLALAVNDSPVAVGLGFGTSDMPPIARYIPKGDDRLPPGTQLSAIEYLVTAKFLIFTGTTLELAAIGHHAAPPAPFTGLLAETTFANRATQTDGAESVSVRVSWAAPEQQAGAALLSRRAPADTHTVNSARPAGTGGFEPYLTEYRVTDVGTPPADLRPAVTVPDEPVPVSGSSVTAYAVAPVDVHGRWGGWRIVSHTATARPVQAPGLHDVALALPATLPASGPVAAGCTLTVEFSWDWADRSLDRVEVHGAFVPIGTTPSAVNGFQADNTATAGPRIVVSFSSAGVPSVPGPMTVSEVAEPDPDPAAPPPASVTNDVRRYRLRVPTLNASFGASDELVYAVSIGAAEHVRPAELSAPVGPRVTSVLDPFPSPPPALPPVQVLWTALPDANRRARAVLSWPAVPGAAGYNVWEATEVAVFHAVSGGGAPTPGQTLRTRAGDLRARIVANDAASLQAFSRINERPLAETSVELSLPGAADTLFAYRVSSVTAQNVESPRSADVVLVGVPHLEVPGTPRLEATADAAAGEVELIVLPGAAPLPDTVRVHRVRRQSLTADVGTMGPPRLGPVAVAGLPTTSVPQVGGPAQTGWRLVDSASPDWQPYLYRCVASGRHEPDDGRYRGDSPGSGVVAVLVAPPAAPLVAAAARSTGTAGVLVTFASDLPWAPSPAGRGTITVSELAVVGTTPTRTVVASMTSEEVPEGAALSASGTPVTEVHVTRRAPVDGVAEVSVLLPPPSVGVLLLNATDPFGRSTIVELS
jgi:hypothetical protein